MATQLHALRTHETRFRAMGTEVHVMTVEGDAALVHVATERILELEQRWSRFLRTSEVSRLNDHAGLPQQVSADTYELVSKAVTAWRTTHGLFDPTVGAALVCTRLRPRLSIDHHRHPRSRGAGLTQPHTGWHRARPHPSSRHPPRRCELRPRRHRQGPRGRPDCHRPPRGRRRRRARQRRRRSPRRGRTSLTRRLGSHGSRPDRPWRRAPAPRPSPRRRRHQLSAPSALAHQRGRSAPPDRPQDRTTRRHRRRRGHRRGRRSLVG